MIGKLYTSIVQFYDSINQRNSFKSRPVLIIGEIRNNDYTILPVSTISRKENLDPDYDIEVKKSQYPKLGLAADSYIRTHKRMYIHKGSLRSEISDLKAEYPDLFISILEKMEQFDNELLNNAL